VEAREYSARLGTIRPEQFQAALDRFGLGRLLAAEPALAGLFGQNVFLTTSEGEFVFRGAPHYGWGFAKGEQFRKERFYARLIHERTAVPAPWPYLLEESEDLFGWEYAIMPRLPGVQIGLPAERDGLSDDDQGAIATALGVALGELHGLTWPEIGDYDLERDTVRPDERPFVERVLDSIERWYERCRAAAPGALTEADMGWCESMVSRNAAALQVPFAPTLVHLDYKEANTVAMREGPGRWRISGVFDLMGWQVGDPEKDLVRSIVDYAGRRGSQYWDFVAGYRSLRELRPGFRERFSIYMLRDCLVLWEYGQRNGVWFEPGQSFREWATHLVELNPF
jgi:aminoglycoside phosphotransferase (APT) family kinase protein